MRSKVSIQQILQNEYYNQPNKTYVLGTHVGYSYYMNEYSYIQPEYNFTHKTQIRILTAICSIGWKRKVYSVHCLLVIILCLMLTIALLRDTGTTHISCQYV